MHRILNTSVLLLTVIAFILIFVDVKGYTVVSRFTKYKISNFIAWNKNWRVFFLCIAVRQLLVLRLDSWEDYLSNQTVWWLHVVNMYVLPETVLWSNRQRERQTMNGSKALEWCLLNNANKHLFVTIDIILLRQLTGD